MDPRLAVLNSKKSKGVEGNEEDEDVAGGGARQPGSSHPDGDMRVAPSMVLSIGVKAEQKEW